MITTDTTPLWEAKQKPIEISELTVPMDYAGIMLDDPLAPGSGADLLQSFLQGRAFVIVPTPNPNPNLNSAPSDP